MTLGDDGLSGQNTTSESRTNTFRINGALGATTDILIDGATDTTAYYNQAAWHTGSRGGAGISRLHGCLRAGVRPHQRRHCELTP